VSVAIEEEVVNEEGGDETGPEGYRYQEIGTSKRRLPRKSKKGGAGTSKNEEECKQQ
jgi:hypothetical protein